MGVLVIVLVIDWQSEKPTMIAPAITSLSLLTIHHQAWLEFTF